MEQLVHDSRAARVGQQFRLVAEQASRRDVEHHARAAAAGGPHLHQLALAFRKLLHDDAGVALVDVDDDFLDRFELLAGAGVRLENDLRS